MKSLVVQDYPEILASDERFTSIGGDKDSRADIYLAGYWTSFGSGDFGVRSAAGQLFNNLLSDHVFDRKNIVFIAHSTGGIVVREILTGGIGGGIESEERVDDLNDKNIALALFASPSDGSKWANRLNFLIDHYHNKMAKELQKNNQELGNLDFKFRRLLNTESGRYFRLFGADYYESKFIAPDAFCLFFPFFCDTPVVGEGDTGSYFETHQQIADVDHFTIVKPKNKEYDSHTYLSNFYRDFRKKSPQLDKLNSRVYGNSNFFASDNKRWTEQRGGKIYNSYDELTRHDGYVYLIDRKSIKDNDINNAKMIRLPLYNGDVQWKYQADNDEDWVAYPR